MQNVTNDEIAINSSLTPELYIKRKEELERSPNMDKKVYEDLLYVELPNLVNRILKEKSKPASYSTAFDKAVLEISKVVNAEFKAAEVAFKIVSQQ